MRLGHSLSRSSWLAPQCLRNFQAREGTPYSMGVEAADSEGSRTGSSVLPLSGCNSVLMISESLLIGMKRIVPQC